MSDDSTAGLDPEKLAQLLAIGSSVSTYDEQHPGKTRVEALQAWLDGAPPADVGVVDPLPEARVCPPDKRRPVTYDSLREALLAPDANAGVLLAFKAYFKELADGSTSKSQRTVCVVLYYASIANALVSNDKRIAQLSYEQLEGSFEELIKKDWVLPELKALFTKAKLVCHRKKN